MRTTITAVLSLAVTVVLGCSAVVPEGSEASARNHFNQEFQEWIAGRESDVTTQEFRIGALLAPVSYEVRSITTESPDPLAFSEDLPEGWEQWPAYRFNVAIEWKSKAGTPIEKLTTYRLTWNSHEKKWFVSERFF